MPHYPSNHYHAQQGNQYFHATIRSTSTPSRSRSSTPAQQRRQQALQSTPQHVSPIGPYEIQARLSTPNRQRQGEYQRRIPPRRHYPSDGNPTHKWNFTAREAEEQPSFPPTEYIQQQDLPNGYYSPHVIKSGRNQPKSNTYSSTSYKNVPRYANTRSNNNYDQKQTEYPSTPYSQHSSESLRQLERLRQEHRDDEIQLQLMRERESEIVEINQKVNKVNEIYEDLAELINGQQDLIDKIDVSLEESNVYTQSGINNYEEARLRFENPILEDPFGDKLGSHSKHTRAAGSHSEHQEGRRRMRGGARSGVKMQRNQGQEHFDCAVPFETIQDDLKEVLRDVKSLGSKIVLACTAPNDQYYNEYATYR
jgi:t-SNARE complex subunit, syntaxin